MDSASISDLIKLWSAFCDEADVLEWLQLHANDQGYKMLDDEDIIQTETMDVVHDDRPEEEEPNSIPSHAELRDMLTSVTHWWNANQRPLLHTYFYIATCRTCLLVSECLI